jgi:hypothetical protein
MIAGVACHNSAIPDVGQTRACVDPPSTRPVAVNIQPDSSTAIKVIVVQAGGERLEGASLLVRRLPRGDTLLYALGSGAHLDGVAADSVEILARRVGFFRRSVMLRLANRATTVVTIPLDQAPSDWCGSDAIVAKPNVRTRTPQSNER